MARFCYASPMRYLFVHQNFPGQFRHVARALADDPANEVVGLGEAERIKTQGRIHPRVALAGYPAPKKAGPETHHYLREYEAHVRRGQQAARAARQLKLRGFQPDVVVVHPGWGEALFLRELFPQARHVHYCEYYYRPDGADVAFDPEFPSGFDDRLRIKLKNSTQLVGLMDCDAGVAPTRWQRSLYPAQLQPAIQVLHEGIDTDLARPSPEATLEVDGHVLRAGDEVVTYVARNLEPYRGFHRFLRALPLLQQRRPRARVLIVGGDDVSYGRRLPGATTYRAHYRAELEEQVDWTRVHFLGKLPYQRYLNVLQVSAAHVYLTYPFVLSWSMLEAMACGCLVVGSATAPVQEVIADGENGLLTDFFDAERLAATVARALAEPDAMAPLRARARDFVREHYDLHTRCLPAWVEFLKQ